MRKLCIVLKENKNKTILNESGVFAGKEDQFEEFLALEKMLKTSTDPKIKAAWLKIQTNKKYTTSTPLGNVANFKFFMDALEQTATNIVAVSDQSFIDLIQEAVPKSQSFFNSFGKSTDDVTNLNTVALIELLQEYYKATILPLLFLNDANKLNAADYAYGNYLSGVNSQQIKPRIDIVRKAAETVSSRKTGTAAGFRTALLGSGEDTYKAAITELARIFGNVLATFVAKKDQSDSLSKSSVERAGAGEGGGGTGPTTTTPPEGAGGEGGEPPPTSPPTGTPPTGTPSSRVIPISSGLYRDLTTGGIPRTVALEIVRALRADLEGAGYTLRESLQNTKPTLTDILLREEYLYTSALHDLLLLEKSPKKNNNNFRFALKKARTLDDIENLQKTLNRAKEEKEGFYFKPNDLQTILDDKKKELGLGGITPTPTKDDGSSASSTEPESTPEPEAPSSDKSVDYWNEYFVNRTKDQSHKNKDGETEYSFATALSALDKGDFKKFIDSYTQWILGRKAAIEKYLDKELPNINLNLREEVTSDERPRKANKKVFSEKVFSAERPEGYYDRLEAGDDKTAGRKLTSQETYNKNLTDYDKLTGGNFVKKYTNLITAVRKIRELSDLGGPNSPELAKELGDSKAMMQHIKAAFPEELRITPKIQKQIFDLFMNYTKDKLKQHQRGYKSAESHNLVKDLGKKKVIDQKNLAQFVKNLNGKTEADRAALKKINVQNIAVKTVKNFLSNYGIRLGENRYQAIANVLITESAKHYNLVREYHEHVRGNLLPYMQKQIGFNRPPTINFVDDPINAQNPFGKTAYYDPQLMEITVYTTGRHPKDIMRSVAHEVIHHAQNCRGQLDPQRMGEASEGYAQKNPYLRKLEEEAYLLGNMTFRDWEDGMKTNQLNEMHDCNKVHPNKSHAAYKREDKPEKEEKSLDEWRNEERWDLLMKRFNIVSEKRFANDPKLDKDGDGKPKWADEDDNNPKDSKKQVKGKQIKGKQVKGKK